MLRLLFFLSVMGVLSFYVFARLNYHAPFAPLSMGWVALVSFLCVLLQLFAFKSNYFIPGAHADVRWKQMAFSWLAWAVYTVIGAFYCMIIFTAVTDIASIAWGILSPATPLALINKWTFYTVLALTFSTTALGILQATATPSIEKVKIFIRNLPKDFDGFKIVQVSDLHVGPLIHRGFVEKVARAVNSLDPDIAALTGDFADGRAHVLKKDMEPLNDIRIPKYFILGNHEYYWRPQEWVDLYREMGMHVLINSHDVIRRGDSALVIAGVEDYSLGRKRSDPALAFAGAPEGTARILLAHQPSDYARAHRAGAHLQLSGHTHGGQFFPWNFVVRFFHRYFTGLHKYQDMWLYINRGTGFWGTPLRTFVPPEITLLTLHTVE